MPFLESELPFATKDLGGVGGILKSCPEDFVVTERPLYQPEGEGNHAYIDIERSGMETRTVVSVLSEALQIAESEIGCAGRKDKYAVARQWFSIPWEEPDLSTISEVVGVIPGLKLHHVTRHKNKLRRGHNLGNTFLIRLRDIRPDAELIGTIADRLKTEGMPNFFGPQRFGGDGLNADIGKAVLLGRRIRNRSQRTLLLNAWQSSLFNQWLTTRLETTGMEVALVGDIARVEGRGGLFEVVDADVESARLKSQETSLTGPMFGAKMMPATGAAGDVEQVILAPEDLPQGILRKNRLSGSRRPARVLVQGLTWELDGNDLILSFFLPKGSYATVLVREFSK
ncbi:MAG: tRNA pseudouridine13 synthase [Planctomycetota bacterium]|jgi:tRNA pseudouridine13 synthase